MPETPSPSTDLLNRVPEPLRPLVRPLIGRDDLPDRLARMTLVFPGKFKRQDREQPAFELYRSRERLMIFPK